MPAEVAAGKFSNMTADQGVAFLKTNSPIAFKELTGWRYVLFFIYKKTAEQKAQKAAKRSAQLAEVLIKAGVHHYNVDKPKATIDKPLPVVGDQDKVSTGLTDGDDKMVVDSSSSGDQPPITQQDEQSQQTPAPAPAPQIQDQYRPATPPRKLGHKPTCPGAPKKPSRRQKGEGDY